MFTQARIVQAFCEANAKRRERRERNIRHRPIAPLPIRRVANP